MKGEVFSGFQEGQSARSRILFGPLDKNAYSPHVSTRIEKDFNPTNDIGIRERTFLWNNYQDLLVNSLVWHRDTNITYELRDFLFIARSRRSLDSQIALGDSEAQRQILLLQGKESFTDSDKPFLAYHIQEVRDASQLLLFKDDGSLRFPESFLSERHAKLLTHVASEWHDILKLLSNREGQVPPEHEVFMAEFLEYLKNSSSTKNVNVGQEVWQLTHDDIDFLREVIGDHETVGKHERGHFTNPQNETDRAKGLFFLIDDFLGVTEDGKGFDREKLAKRFNGGFRSLIDPTIRRVFEPGWANENIQHYLGVLSHLSTIVDDPLIMSLMNPAYVRPIVEKGLETIDGVLSRDFLPQEEIDQLMVERDKLERLFIYV